MAKIAILRCLLVILPLYRKGSSAYSPKPHSAPHFEGHYVEGMEEWASHYCTSQQPLHPQQKT